MFFWFICRAIVFYIYQKKDVYTKTMVFLPGVYTKMDVKNIFWDGSVSELTWPELSFQQKPGVPDTFHESYCLVNRGPGSLWFIIVPIQLGSISPYIPSTTRGPYFSGRSWIKVGHDFSIPERWAILRLWWRMFLKHFSFEIFWIWIGRTWGGSFSHMMAITQLKLTPNFFSQI